MDWSKLDPIPGDGRGAAILNRHLKDLADFRERVDSGKAVGQFYAAQDAIDEALRRELVIRSDIAVYLTQKKIDGSANAAALAAVRTLLDEREGHRS